MSASVRVGLARVSVVEAADIVRRYTDESTNRLSAHPYAYPAYDSYGLEEVGRDADSSAMLSDADLLAPLLLNVKVSLRSYYALQRVRVALDSALAGIELGMVLADASDDEIARLVAPLYAVLDENDVPGVKATTLSKVLHRKRPAFLVLHDSWVRACYLGTPRVPVTRTRSWSNYMSLISQAIADDLRTQHEIFADLASRVAGTTPLTSLRILDVLAWTLRGGDRGAGGEQSS